MGVSTKANLLQKSQQTVIIFEHRAATAKQMRARAFHRAIRTCADQFLYEVHNVSWRRDHTRHDRQLQIARVGLVCRCLHHVRHLADAVKDGKFVIETFMLCRPFALLATCRLLRHSTGAETHELIAAELQSIACPPPKCRIASASGDPKRTATYNC